MRKVKKSMIIYPQGTVRKLSEAHGTTERSVRNALNFVTQSATADAIRKDCLDNYGGKITEVLI